MIRRAPKLLISLGGLVLVIACSGDESNHAPAATSTPIAIEESNKADIQINGFTLIPRGSWNQQKKSPCASLNDEAPYYGAAVYGVREQALPDLGVTASFVPRMCNISGMTALGTTVSNLRLSLVAGPREWPLEPHGQQLQATTVAGRDAVMIRADASRVLLVSTRFGMVLVATRRPGATEQDVLALAGSLNYDALFVPSADESFRGEISGIRFYNQQIGERRSGCEVTQYGNEGREVGLEAAQAAGITVDLGRLPPGTTNRPAQAFSCAGSADLYMVDLGSVAEPGTYFARVYRATGEAAWHNVYSRAWLQPTTVGGRPAVVTLPPPGIAADFYQLFIREPFGITVVSGPDLDFVRQAAESLY